MADTVAVYHPTLPDVSREVDKGEVKRWQDAGWRKSEPTSAKAQSAEDE